MLTWYHQWSTSIPIWQRFVDEGRIPPNKEYFEQPEVEQHLTYVLDAFHDLGTERQSGMGAGPIPSSKIREYAAGELGLSGDQHDRVCRLIRKVDQGYLAVVNAAPKPDDKDAQGRKTVKDASGVKRFVKSRSAKSE